MKLTVLHELISFYDTTTSGVYQDAARIMLKNIKKIEKLSINELAELCFVSTTTINRLVRKIGCASYGDFKKDIAREIAEYPTLNRCAPYTVRVDKDTAANYTEFFVSRLNSLLLCLSDDALDKVAEAVHNAGKVCLYMDYAMGHSKSVFQFDLVMDGKDTSFWGENDMEMEDMKTLEAGDVVITYWAPYTQYAEKAAMLKQARDKGAKTVIISSKAVPNASKYADFLIEFDGSRTAMDQYFADIFISILTCRYRNKYIDAV